LNPVRLGTFVTLFIVVGVALILMLNREPARAPLPAREAKPGGQGGGGARPGSPRETPIGDEVVKNHMTVAAVWIPSVGMAGMPEPTDDVIHLEADVKSTADNPNGFAEHEFVPYLKIRYELYAAAGGTKPIQSGELGPMIAADGLHYGAAAGRPAPGRYRLIYKLEPPSAGGLGRHLDVAAWWNPFEVSFDWVMEAADPAPPAAGAAASAPR
jgi:uncharacterized protein involved in high-affinity Fe2+ transport